MLPEIVASPVPVTNGRGVFAVPLGEWAISAMLHFSYQHRRLIRDQEEERWVSLRHGWTAGENAGDHRIRRDRKSNRHTGESFRDENHGVAAQTRDVLRRSAARCGLLERPDQSDDVRERLPGIVRTADARNAWAGRKGADCRDEALGRWLSTSAVDR